MTRIEITNEMIARMIGDKLMPKACNHGGEPPCDRPNYRCPIHEERATCNHADCYGATHNYTADRNDAQRVIEWLYQNWEGWKLAYFYDHLEDIAGRPREGLLKTALRATPEQICLAAWRANQEANNGKC